MTILEAAATLNTPHSGEALGGETARQRGKAFHRQLSPYAESRSRVGLPPKRPGSTLASRFGFRSDAAITTSIDSMTDLSEERPDPGAPDDHERTQARSVPRIVFLNRFFYPDLSATSQMLSDLAFALAERGFDVQVITSRLRYDDVTARMPARETIRRVRVHRIWTSGFGRHNLWGRGMDYLSFYASALRACIRTLRPGDILVAKTDPPMISVIGAIATRWRGALLVNWLQDLFPEVAAAAGIRSATGWTGGFLRAVRDWSLRHARVNVAIGRRMRKLLVERGIDASRVAVIENWADGALIRPVPHAENPLRREWGLEGQFVVGYSGNMGIAHEFDTILDAAEQLKGREDIRFLLIGAGKHLPYVRQEIHQRGLDNVALHPYQPRERLSESLSVADVHLISLQPKFEGLIVPSKFYGISAAGRPCLHIGAMDGELTRQIVPENRFAIGDSENLSRRIEELAVHTDELQRLGRMRRERLLAGQTVERKVDRWAEVLGGQLGPQQWALDYLDEVHTSPEHR